MASLWTPEGEHRVERGPSGDPPAPHSDVVDGSDESDGSGISPEQAAAMKDELAQLERELLSAPVEAIIANHCYGFFQLAALHLGQQPPRIEDARLAIDALASVVDGLGDRLGPATEMLRDALAQIRLAFVQISSVQPGANGAGTSNGTEAN